MSDNLMKKIKKVNKQTNKRGLNKKSLQNIFQKRIEACDTSEQELMLKLYNEILEELK